MECGPCEVQLGHMSMTVAVMVAEALLIWMHWLQEAIDPKSAVFMAAIYWSGELGTVPEVQPGKPAAGARQ